MLHKIAKHCRAVAITCKSSTMAGVENDLKNTCICINSRVNTNLKCRVL